MRVAPEHTRNLISAAVLAAISAIAAALILSYGSGLTFLRDEWIFLLYRDGSNLDTYLASHAGHLVAIPAAIYLFLFKAVGPDSYVWWRILGVVVYIASAWLVFALARPRLGGPAAIAPALVILFLGSSWLNILWPFQMAFTGAVVFGLLALLALDMKSRAGDIAACAALVIAVGWSGVAVPFLAAAAAGLVVRRRVGAAWWAVAAPVALIAAWNLRYGVDRPDYAANLPDVPSYALHMLAAIPMGLFGTSQGVGIVLAIAGIGLAAWGLWTVRQSSPLAWEAAAGLLAFVAVTALSRAQDDDPGSNRYIYVSVVFALLLAAGVAPRGVKGNLPTAALLVVAVLTLPHNLGEMKTGRSDLRYTSGIVKAELGAVEISRGTVDPAYSPEMVEFYAVPAGLYLAAIDRYADSPADTPAQITAAREEERRDADNVLVEALPVALRPAPASAARSCRGREVTDGALLPRRGVVITAGAAGPAVAGVRRFADAFTKVGTVPSGASRLLAPPRDLAPSVPWHLGLSEPGAVACPAPVAP